MTCFDTPDRGPGLNLRVKIEECFEAQPKLRLDLFPAALEHMHRDPRLIAVLQCHRSVAYRRNLIGW